jgi:hypothetical protein
VQLRATIVVRNSSSSSFAMRAHRMRDGSGLQWQRHAQCRRVDVTVPIVSAATRALRGVFWRSARRR